ncbi:TatD family hydrolase [Amphritea japonica]|uniref:TatD DNase family protein n=1 Tax=Amphritea japonica ATCC BAA-1530 TaxID=1278309 RepID=A0A7R6PDP6_9GAMM|nr:TatD family hydrolase [Amphritea japonica]BBB26216.1 TatD DNase family protein [Amphritea japonica ATCC BAA-1530]
MFVDSHCHLDRLDLSARNNELTSVIDAAASRDVSRMLCVAIDMEQLPYMLQTVKRFDNVYASVGVHPLHVADGIPERAFLLEYAADPKVVALGETGLDYFYSQDTVELQKESFIRHLQASADTRLPVIVHTRDAREDTISILRQHADPEVGGVLHCFTENWEMARQAMDLNYMISFSGIITFRNAEALREVVRQVPIESILIETDAPYLTPVPFRGKPNEPQYVVEVAQCVADIKGLRIEEVAEITTNNFDRLFNKAAAK